ncbi:MAG: septum site-determining protein MinC [Buchnera aphidicola (Schlechtendalia peitan)]
MKIFSLELQESNFKILVLYLRTNSTILISQELNKKISISPNAFKNLPIIIDIEKVSNIENWNIIKDIINSFNLHIIGVSNCQNDNLKQLIKKSGLPILKKIENISNKFHLYKSNYNNYAINNNKKTKIIDFPIRSGQKIYANNSDLIIISHVSSGAEIIADGNIHIYGNMRGRVLAGANGDMTSQIFCMKFFAELVSISGEYLLSDQFYPNFIGKSVRIYIQNKKLNILKID